MTQKRDPVTPLDALECRARDVDDDAVVRTIGRGLLPHRVDTATEVPEEVLGTVINL